jgi:hypothetical protein
MPLPQHPPSPVDLHQLRMALTRDLGIAVTHPGVASTFDPVRVSHDRQDRTALVTYGHPDLERDLQRIAAEVGEPVIRVEREGVVAWARADRVPPVLVRSVEDLRDLETAVSTGDTAALRWGWPTPPVPARARPHRHHQPGRASASSRKAVRGDTSRMRRLISFGTTCSNEVTVVLTQKKGRSSSCSRLRMQPRSNA